MRKMYYGLKSLTMSLVLVGMLFVIAACGSSGTQEVGDDSSNSTIETSVDEEPAVNEELTSETVDVEEEVSDVSEEIIEKVDNDSFILAVTDALDGAIAPDEQLKDISFDGTNLTISIEILGDTSDYAKKLVAEASINALTFPILDLDEQFYNTWDTIILDFGDVGTIVLDKSMVVDEGLGKYFDVPEGVLK